MDDFKKLTEQLLKIYINSESVNDLRIENYFDENISLIGTGQHEIYRNLHEFLESFEFDVKRRGKIRIDIQDLHQEEEQLDDDHVLAHGTVDFIGLFKDGSICFKMATRFTIIYKRTNGKWLVQHLHQSTPDLEQMDGEEFPVTLGKQVKKTRQAFYALGTAYYHISRGYMENRDLNFCVSREELKTPYVMADELRIREVLLNIISNAVKFTKDGGTISFVAENCPGNDEHHVIVRYRISDTGIGMSEEFQSRIFDEFTQENDGARTSYKGTGLGMAIAKKYVDLMGGKIEVSSRQGIGSTFTVEIPLRIAEQVLTEKEEKLRKDMDLHGLHVLLAEDNDLNAEIAVSLLEEQGMIVTRAADGKSALLQFCNTAPGTFDLILMDIMMPEMNGYETTKAIRNLSDRPDGKEIPIIAMTANAFAEDVQAALDAGMDDHVAKPMDMDILISAIEKCVKR